MIALRRLLVINVDDPLAASLHNVADVEEHCPGVVSGVREWFRWYKTPDDKPINAFGAPPPPPSLSCWLGLVVARCSGSAWARGCRVCLALALMLCSSWRRCC